MTRFCSFSDSQASGLDTRQRRELAKMLTETVYRIPNGHSPGKPSYGGLHGNAVIALERRGLIRAQAAEVFSLTEEGWAVLREIQRGEGEREYASGGQPGGTCPCGAPDPGIKPGGGCWCATSPGTEVEGG